MNHLDCSLSGSQTCMNHSASQMWCLPTQSPPSARDDCFMTGKSWWRLGSTIDHTKPHAVEICHCFFDRFFRYSCYPRDNRKHVLNVHVKKKTQFCIRTWWKYSGFLVLFGLTHGTTALRALSSKCILFGPVLDSSWVTELLILVILSHSDRVGAEFGTHGFKLWVLSPENDSSPFCLLWFECMFLSCYFIVWITIRMTEGAVCSFDSKHHQRL